MEPTLALHIIAKDETEQLKRIISTYGQFFDEVAIAYDDDCILDEIAETGDIKLHKYEWCDDFADKRNFLVSKTVSSHYLRMDTDDDILNPELVRPLFKKMVEKDMDVVLCQYLYSFDEDGNCNTKHWRETIIKKSDNCVWNKPVHENILVGNQADYRAVNDSTVLIKHNITPDHIESSGKRNFTILLKEFNENQDNPDPRTVAYLGRMLLSYERYEEAIKFLELLVAESGWEDDKYFAWIDMAHCYMGLNKPDMSIACCNEALAIKTDFPDAYNYLGQVYLAEQKYKKAIDWLKIGLAKPVPNTQYVIDPSNYTVRAPMNMAIALFGSGDFENAYKIFKKVQRIAPSLEIVESNEELFETAYEREQYMKHLMWMNVFVKENEPKKLVDLVNSIPSCMLQDERVHSFRNCVLPAKVWSDKSIVFYCGSSWEDWSAPSVVSGVGGSEEAVIYISQEFVKLGYEVTVFNNCGDMAGIFNGVEYKPFYEFNPKDEYNTIISWRRNMISPKTKRKNHIVWLHDVPCPDMFQDGYDFDKLLVLSEYHKSLLPANMPEEKIFVTTNGINIKDFKESKLEREPNRLIYASSYDRGIENLLMIWEDVKAEVPEAELHLFYGWDVYDKLVASGRREPGFKERMVKLMDQPGITEHGRIGHKKLNKEFAKSKFWVYPSHFEEISCITAMKAQAMGCTPVCTDYAALAETVKDGVVIPGNCKDDEVREAYKVALIKAMKEQTVVTVDKEQFGWDKVAKSWSENIF